MSPRTTALRKAYTRVWYWGLVCGWAVTTATMAAATVLYAWSRA